MIQGKLSGDPVDLIMFNAVGFGLQEPPVSEPLLFDLVAPTVVTSAKSEEEDRVSIYVEYHFYGVGFLIYCLENISKFNIIYSAVK